MPAPQPTTPPKNAPANGKEPFVVEGPPDEEFWERYNRRLEFPLATVATVFFHVLVGAVLVYVLVGLMSDADTSGPTMQIAAVGGMDDTGEGSEGSGGQEDPDLIRDVKPITAAQQVLPTPQALADAKETIQKIVLDDPNGRLPIAPSNAATFSQIDESLRKKLLGVGAQKGEGNQGGKGSDGSAGTGPGGTGADSTRARGLRWVLRFKVANGRDYLAQLQAMKAEILVPIPGTADSILIKDISNPGAQRKASDADLRDLAKKIQFSDTRRDAVQGVAGALGLDFTPKTFFAFFPKGLEEDLARLETSYRNRRAEDIEETIFRVTIRGGTYEFVVDEQQIKR
ncbi:hypothetical protein VT84_32395 [Gemmata sp. SH-PL17]|uniref:hypothetical protein n=1 Tax=Gemmata sp. SH-PL17 TaxID=1630693 RepID=UPI00078E062C|nr:hypothetical protein [Gemmata sp. SH-PL17]AMV29140.1 hypothetical protein VT84_32395 [Gemmata sp. SH-PL17]